MCKGSHPSTRCEIPVCRIQKTLTHTLRSDGSKKTHTNGSHLKYNVLDKCIDDDECEITFPETKPLTDPLNKEYCDISKATQIFTILVDAYDDTSTYDTCYFNEESINDYKHEGNNELDDLYYLNSV